MHKGLTTPDGPERAAIYAEVDDIGQKEAAVIPLYQIPKSFAMRSNISGFVYDTLRRAVWWEADKRDG
jgi:ABC-type transport system substrate-binding protein